MQISNIKANRITPFDIDDKKLVRLFSFFLHSAPTIDSATAANIDSARLERNWNNFVSEIPNVNRIIIKQHNNTKEYIEKYGLNDEASINRRSKGFVCKRDKNEKDCECVLRHIRNAIAHSNVYMSNAGNRKYIILEDFNRSKVLSAIILFSQADLNRLKKIIMM